MVTYNLCTPISEAQVRKLEINDLIYLTGTIITARDQAHRRALEFKKASKPVPIDFEGLAVFHCGPVMRKEGEQWITVAAGPTTSTRMEDYEDEFIEAFKPRLIIGKGGMGKRTADAMQKHGAVYGAFTGGAAVLAAKAVKRVETVEWLDLGMPEAMWVLQVEKFGPLVVAIDSHGCNLYAKVSAAVEENKRKIYERLQL